MTPRCQYCNGNGWFYSDPDLGPCICEAGERNRETEAGDALEGIGWAAAIIGTLYLLVRYVFSPYIAGG